MPPGQIRRAHERVRVLVADDNRLFAKSMSVALSARPNVDVVGTAENGYEAFALAAELQPDLVLMDVSMPLLDGIEATRMIRRLPEPPLVAFVTGDDEMSDTRAYAAGGAAYLRKSAALFSMLDVVLALTQSTTRAGAAHARSV
jgi:CheY-like chemotaxis protein